MALATTADFETLTGQNLDNAERARVEGLLEMASEVVLASAHGQLIVEDTYTDVTLYGHEGVFLFPQRPVTAVASVEVHGTSYSSDYWRFTPGGNGRPAELIKRLAGRDVSWCWHEATVTYTAGWAEDAIPAQIRAAVVAVASGVYRGSTNTTVSFTAGGAPVENYPAVNLALTAMKITPAVQAQIDRVCKVRPPTSVEMRRG